MTTTREPQRGSAVRERRWPFGNEDDMERFFERMMRGFAPRRWWGFARPMSFFRRGEIWSPDIDILEKNGNLVIRVDLPGMKREDIEVTIEGDTLVIRGRRQEDKEVKEEDYYCAERLVGEFSRSIRLPEGVKTDSIQASYQEGVLEVQMPRPVTAEPKKLTVQVK